MTMLYLTIYLCMGSVGAISNDSLLSSYIPVNNTEQYLNETTSDTDEILNEQANTFYEPDNTTDENFYEPDNTTDWYFDKPAITTNANFHEPENTSIENFYEPPNTLDESFYESPNISDGDFHEQSITTDENFYEPPITTDENFYEPTITTDENFYEPPITTDENFYESAITTDENFHEPENTTDANFYEPPITTDGIFYEPSNTTDENLYEPANTNDENLYEPANTIDENFYESAITTDKNFQEPSITTDKNFQEPSITTDKNFQEPSITTDENFYEPANTTDENFYEPANTTDENFYEPANTTDENFYEPANTTDENFYEPANNIDEYNDTFTPITINEVEELLRSPETQAFLGQFAEDKRVAVRTYLFHCPYAPLCGFSFNLTLPLEYESPCLECQCSSGCAFDRSCCPDILPDSMFISTQPDGESIYKCPSIYNTGYEPLLPCIGPMAYLFFDITGFCLKSDTGNAEGTTYIFDSLIDYVPIQCQTCFLEDDEGAVVRKREVLEFSCPRIQQSIFRSDRQIVKELINDKHHICSFLIASQNNIMISNICLLTVSTCNTTGQWSQFDPIHSTACSSFYAPFIYNGVAYSNLFCVLCNGFVPTDVYSLPVWLNEEVIYFEGTLKPDTYGHNESVGDVGDCAKEEMYIPAMATCLPASCAPTHILDNGVCVKVINKMGRMRYDAYFRLFPENQTTLSTSMNLSMAIITWFRLLLDIPINEDMRTNCSTIQLVHAVKLDGHHTFTNTSDLVDAPIDYIDVSTQFTFGFGHDPGMIFGFIEGFHGSTIPFGDAANNFQVFIKDTTKPNWLCDNKADLEHLNHVTEAYLNAQSADVCVWSDGHLVLLDINSDLDLAICESGALTSNIVVYNPCSRVRLDKENIVWEENDKGASLMLKDSRIEIDSVHYFHGDDEAYVMVCSHVIRLTKHLMDVSIVASLSLKLPVPWVMIVDALFAISLFN